MVQCESRSIKKAFRLSTPENNMLSNLAKSNEMSESEFLRYLIKREWNNLVENKLSFTDTSNKMNLTKLEMYEIRNMYPNFNFEDDIDMIFNNMEELGIHYITNKVDDVLASILSPIQTARNILIKDNNYIELMTGKIIKLKVKEGDEND